MIMANGEFNLPYNVVGLQYLNYEGSKFSKSQGHGVFCENLPTAGLEADYWRFYLSFLIPETKDTDFFWKEFQERVNTELVGNFGNLINRTLSFIESKFKGKVPKPKLTPKDKAFLKEAEKQIDKIIEDMEDVRLREGIEGILALSAMSNRYFQNNEPWKDTERAKTILFVCANMCRILGLLVQPYLPLSSIKLLGMLGVKEETWKDVKRFKLKPGHKIKKPQLLFRKIEDEEIENLKKKTSKITEYFKEKEKVVTPIDKSKQGPFEERSMMQSEKERIEMPKEKEKKEPLVQELEVCPACHHVSFEEFKKMDIRVGKIVKIEPHPNADKLYVLLVDLGFGENKRQIVAGLRQHYSMEELMGKKIVMITNLQPALIRGIESNGMLLAAVDKGKVVLVTPEKDIEEGAKVE